MRSVEAGKPPEEARSPRVGGGVGGGGGQSALSGASSGLRGGVEGALISSIVSRTFLRLRPVALSFKPRLVQEALRR